MANVARNRKQVAPTLTDSPSQAQEQAPIPSWQRQPGEPLLWYNRYRTYRNLGYKRSLVAALLKEQEKAKVLESPKTAEMPGGMSKKCPVKSAEKRSPGRNPQAQAGASSWLVESCVCQIQVGRTRRSL